MSTTKQPCKAKDPRTCPWHGAELRMEEAQKTGDFEAYYEARRELDLLSEKKTWNEEDAEPVTPYSHDEIRNKLKEIIEATDGIDRFESLIELAQGKEVFLEGIEKPFQEINYAGWEEGDGKNNIHFIVKHDGHLLKFTGWHDSWNGTEWYNNIIEEVEEEISIATQIKKQYKNITQN